MTVLTGSAHRARQLPWWPDLALAPEPLLPPDPDPDLAAVHRDEPDEWGELSVDDPVDDADRADLDRLCASSGWKARPRPARDRRRRAGRRPGGGRGAGGGRRGRRW